MCLFKYFPTLLILSAFSVCAGSSSVVKSAKDVASSESEIEKLSDNDELSKNNQEPETEKLVDPEIDDVEWSKNIDVNKIGVSKDESSLYNEGNEDNEGGSSISKKKGSSAISALKNIDISNEKKSKQQKFYAAANNQKKFFVVAEVNSDVITNVDIINAIKFIFFSSGKEYDQRSAKLMVKTVINSMISDRLQQQYAKFCKLKVSDEEINERINEIAAKNNLSIEELSVKFSELGINMEMFKKNLKSRMLLSFIIKIMGESTKATAEELAEEKVKAISEIKQTRYHLYEIFFKVTDKNQKEKIKENAKAVLELLKSGFNFQVLAENMSQGNYNGTVGDLGWTTESNIEKAARCIVNSLNRLEFSDIIETATGYKIIYVADKAAPNKAGESSAKYKALLTNIEINNSIFTQKDRQRIDEYASLLMTATTAQQFKDICKKYNLKFEEKIVDKNNSYEMELVSRAKKEKKPSILRSIDNENFANILFLVNEEIPSTSIPTDKELTQEIIAKKIEKEFFKNFKKMSATSLIHVDHEKLSEVFSIDDKTPITKQKNNKKHKEVSRS